MHTNINQETNILNKDSKDYKSLLFVVTVNDQHTKPRLKRNLRDSIQIHHMNQNVFKALVQKRLVFL